MIFANPPINSHCYPMTVLFQPYEINNLFKKMGEWELLCSIPICAYLWLLNISHAHNILKNNPIIPNLAKKCGIMGGCFSGLCGKVLGMHGRIK